MKAKHLLLAVMLLPCVLWGQGGMVHFSCEGGFYDKPFDLVLACNDENLAIHFTIDGDTPTIASPRYSAPLYLDESLLHDRHFYDSVNCELNLYRKPINVPRAIVIRAASFDSLGNRVGDVSTNTFLIASLGYAFHSLPVMAITADADALFGPQQGILVPGKNVDSLGNGANYLNKGKEWERKINIEFIELGNSGINQECGMRVHGGLSRRIQQKGFKLYAREEYGRKNFHYAFFEDTPVKKFKHLGLRPFASSNWLCTGGQDFVASRIAKGLDIDAPCVRMVALFINGEYWGLYTLEECADEHYVEEHYGYNADSVNVTKSWGHLRNGNINDWRLLWKWMKNADLSDTVQYVEACNRIDVDNFIDYIIFETFSANVDWPLNNSLCYQPAPGERFRMMFYDGDGCLFDDEFDVWGNATDAQKRFPTASFSSTLFLNRFLASEIFRQAMKKRYEELRASVLGSEMMLRHLDVFQTTVSNEIDLQSDRYRNPATRDAWKRDIERIRCFLKERPENYVFPF